MPEDAGEPAGRQLGLVWGGAVVAAILVSPWGGVFASWMPGCLFKQLAGIPCPSCGVTRSALALARFDLVHAFAAYPLQSLAWTFFVVGGLAAGALALAGRRLPTMPRRLPWWSVALVAAVVAANWAYSIHAGI